jgi:hypothetical protein
MPAISVRDDRGQDRIGRLADVFGLAAAAR